MAANILSLFAGGYDIKRIVEYYPRLKEKDVREAAQFATDLLQEEEIRQVA